MARINIDLDEVFRRQCLVSGLSMARVARAVLGAWARDPALRAAVPIPAAERPLRPLTRWEVLPHIRAEYPQAPGESLETWGARLHAEADRAIFEGRRW